MIETYIRNNIDSRATFTEWKSKQQLSLSLASQYVFQQLILLDMMCLLLQPTDQIGNTETLKKHTIIIQNIMHCPVIFHFLHLSRYKRKRLVEERIPFIVEDGQMYLPFIALDFNHADAQGNIDYSGLFSPATQLIYLYFLYHESLEADIQTITDVLRFSAITASRALSELYGKNLLLCCKSGKTGRMKVYQRIPDSNYYIKGKNWLRTPVIKTVFMPKDTQVLNYPQSGLEALATLTMLNPPTHPVRAISKAEYQKIKGLEIKAADEIMDRDIVELQVWCYDPNLLGAGVCVDIVSMIQSIKVQDERIEIAINELLREESWYTA